jgi:anti-anti-sigma factor
MDAPTSARFGGAFQDSALRTLLAVVSLGHDGDVVVARVRGELDMSNARPLAEDLIRVLPADAPGVVLDLSEATYLDSSSIEALVRLAERLRERGQRICLVPPPPPVSILVRMSGLPTAAGAYDAAEIARGVAAAR